ncbi:MAG: hypothetical protein ACREEM_15455 [Blastocatellia bacterium]
MRNLLKRLLAAPFVFVATVILLLEDWLWDDLQRMAAAIGRLPVFRQLESLIAGLPPYGALTMFAIPSLLLIPVKLAALWFIANGHPASGFLVVVAAKVAGTALVARLFTLTKPNLLLIGWFAALHERFMVFRTRVYGTIKATAIYRAAHLRYLRVKMAMKAFLQKQRRGFWKRRWEAALKLSRRWKQSEE